MRSYEYTNEYTASMHRQMGDKVSERGEQFDAAVHKDIPAEAAEAGGAGTSIPYEATVAASQAIDDDVYALIGWEGITHILEAAAPHMLRTVTTVEDLDALPHGSVIRSSHRHYWVAHKEDGEGGNQGWAAAGTSRIPENLADWLPVTVLHAGGTK